MRSDEVQGTAELARLTLRGTTRRVREVHRGVSDRVFGAVGPVGRPVRLWHDAVAGLTYAGVGVALGLGARAAGRAAAGGPAAATSTRTGADGCCSASSTAPTATSCAARPPRWTWA